MKLYFILVLLFFIPLISAEEFGYNYLDKGINLNSNINYSTINTNYSQDSGKLEGRNTATLYNYFKGLLDTAYDLIYCKLTGCTMSGNINMGNNNLTNSSYIQGINANFTGNSSIGGLVYESCRSGDITNCLCRHWCCNTTDDYVNFTGC